MCPGMRRMGKQVPLSAEGRHNTEDSRIVRQEYEERAALFEARRVAAVVQNNRPGDVGQDTEYFSSTPTGFLHAAIMCTAFSFSVELGCIACFRSDAKWSAAINKFSDRKAVCHAMRMPIFARIMRIGTYILAC